MSRRKPLIIGIVIVVLIPAIAIGWWLLSPLFINKTVNEEFPLSAGAVVPPGMTQAQAEQQMAEMAAKNQEVMEPMPGMMGTTDPGMTAMPPTTGTAMPMTPQMPGGGMMGTMTPGGMAAPARLKAGTFRDADSFHKGSGQATIYRNTDGSLLLRLEEFRVTNGPDLHVILSTEADPKNRFVQGNAAYFDLGTLKGNIGSQNYSIPSAVNPEAIQSAVIYCLKFHVVFSVAELK
ncbi:MAG: DM13 domain-containing protein [SAR202 cluster bacterium]|nr:DM13 domain-containing protein [SAR202 cluster bacterium]